MNRFEYSNPQFKDNESYVTRERNVKLYDGDQKTSFESGELVITTHRILWGKPGDIPRGLTCLSLHLQLIVYIEEESPSSFSFSRSKRLILHLSEPLPDKNEGPVTHSPHHFVKLSFKDGYTVEIPSVLNDAIQQKKWVINIQMPIQTSSRQQPTIKLRTGIVGIERSIQEKSKATDESISIAFQDLTKLMGMAKDMVRLSQNISSKIREKQGDITEDETVRFKSYLLSLGIEDPVTRDSYKSNNQYYKSLAKQVSDILLEPITEIGGMMALTDVYCRVNRARGLELLSPEDLLNACRLLEQLDLPIRLFKFDSGVMVLQLQSLDNESVAEATLELLQTKGSLSAEELAQMLGVSILLAKERLLTTERCSKACRDDSMEGLRFYPNLFLFREE